MDNPEEFAKINPNSKGVLKYNEEPDYYKDFIPYNPTGSEVYIKIVDVTPTMVTYTTFYPLN